MVDPTPDATPTLDLGPGAEERRERAEAPSAFDPPAARFETVGEIGRGGMGRVDDAFDRALGRPVAIKHMLSASDVDRARFEREARITARLEHPGIVPIHDAGRGPDGTPYYVMRRVDGKPLDALVKPQLADRLALIPNVLAACDAVAFAHARGIVHRDIKPTNILVGPFGETLVIDWGLARQIGEVESGNAVIPHSDQLTRAGTIAGTPGFMAPEQARGEAVDARADVFALGATLFYVLSGELPYGSASATEMVDLAGAGRTPNWKVMPADVPADLRAIAVKAMASEAAERYADAGALAADLRRFITGNLVGAYDYGWTSRLLRFVRRHRAAVAISIVSALLLVVGATLSVRRIVSERDDARAARGLAEAGQRDATAMADRLLVTHARELADSDPLAAVMALRRLAPDSTRWREAWVAAAAAWVHGISSGFQNESAPTLIQANASGEAFALIGVAGKLVVIDLAARTQRTVATIGWGNQAQWISPHTIAALRSDKVELVDTITGAIRVTEVAATYITGDHATKVWVSTPDRRVLELAGPDAEARELMTGVDEFEVALDLSKAIVRRGRRLELWTPTASRLVTELATPTTHWRAALGTHSIAVFDDSELRIWDISNARLVERAHVHQRHLAAVPAGDRWFAHDLNTSTLAMLDAEGQFTGLPLVDIGSYWATRHGLIAVSSKGVLNIYDDDGRFALGPSPLRYQRADMSADGRFVIASAANGDFVIWDLVLVRPTHFTLRSGEQVIDITEHFLWVSLSDQLARYDLATQERQLLIPFGGQLPGGGFVVDDGERFAWMFSASKQQAHLYDVGAKQVRVFDNVAQVTSSAAGLTLARTDGSLFRWQPGDPDLRPIGSFHTPLIDIACQDHYVLGFAKPNTLMRLDLDRGTLETLQHEAPLFAIMPSGRVWISAGTKLWRWDRGQAPVLFEVPDRTDDLIISGERIALHSRHSLTEIRDMPHTLSLEVRQVSWHDDAPVFAAVSAQGTVSVIERTSGLGFSLGFLEVTSIVAARGHKIAYVDGYLHGPDGAQPKVAIWNVMVPDEPAALQRWLTTITNARTVPDSDAHAWPN